MSEVVDRVHGDVQTPMDMLGLALTGDVPSSWDATTASTVIEAAEAHGVTTLLWESLGRSVPGALLRARLDDHARGAATRDLLVRAEMTRVLEAIAGSGARAVVFKGSALVYTVYDCPWHRPRTDTDVLTSATEVVAVSAAIASCGYVQTDALTSGALVSHQVAFEHEDEHGLRHVVDLHWKVVNPQVLADVLTFEEIWADARPAPALGPSARVPASCASAVLACVHRLAHHQGQDRLIWLYDLKLLGSAFQEPEWQRLCDIAEAKRVAAVCLDGFEQAHQRLGAPLPDAVSARLRAAGRTEPSRRYVEAEVLKRDVLVSDLRALPTWAARVRLVREHAFPPIAFMRQRYGVDRPIWLPVLYGHRLVTGAWKWMRERRRTS